MDEVLIYKQHLTPYRLWQNQNEFWNVLPCLHYQAQRCQKNQCRDKYPAVQRWEEKTSFIVTDNKDRRSLSKENANYIKTHPRIYFLNNCFPKYRNRTKISHGCIWSTTTKYCYTKTT